MFPHYVCQVCARVVKATLIDLRDHCDTQHYGQSVDLIFPGHGLEYRPMDLDAKRKLVMAGEARMGKALVGEITKTGDAEMGSHPQMRPLANSPAHDALLCQGWITVKLEMSPFGEIAIMEKF